jgi:hypothetical protein
MSKRNSVPKKRRSRKLRSPRSSAVPYVRLAAAFQPCPQKFRFS